MSRPKSMSDFTSLLDASMPPPLHPYDKSREHPRKKPSISLAAGLIMASAETQSPRSFLNNNASAGSGTSTMAQDSNQRNRDTEGWSEGLFYAYAQKDTSPPTPPSVLTFSSALTASQWWNLIQTAYPSSTRPSPQFFILRTTSSSPSPTSFPNPLLDPLLQIHQNPHFAHLHNKWFFTTPTLDPSTSSIPPPAIIPLQDAKGNPLSLPANHPPHTTITPPPTAPPEPTPPNPDMNALTTALSTLTTLTTENTTQIHALHIAQSASLTTTQQFHETTTSQLRTLASSQSSMQSLLASTSSATKTLAASQTSQKSDLKQQAKNLVAMAETQKILLETSTALVATIDALTTRIQQISTPQPAPVSQTETLPSRPSTPLRSKSNSFALSDTSTLTPSSSPPFMFPPQQQGHTHRTRISPPPRKLNRRIKGVWYEYDMTPGSVISTPGSVAASVASTPSKSVYSNATSTPKAVSAAASTPRAVPSFDPGKVAVGKGSGLRQGMVAVKGKA